MNGATRIGPFTGSEGVRTACQAPNALSEFRQGKASNSLVSPPREGPKRGHPRSAAIDYRMPLVHKD